MSEPQERKNYLVPDVPRWRADQGPVLSLKGVVKSFGANEVLRELSLDIIPGKITVIVGASASGKSVLIKLLNGLLTADGGQVKLFNQDPRELKDQELDKLRKRMGTLFQNYALFDSMTVRQNVSFPLVQNQAMSEVEANKLSAELITELELEHALDLYPSSLSGGMKKRVALARAIITNPEVLLLDEPTTGLDPVMMEFVDKLIHDITLKYGLTTVIISHDMASTFRLADTIAVLYDGKIIEQGSVDEIRQSKDERVRQLIFASDKTAIEAHEPPAAGEQEDDKTVYAVKVRGLTKAFDGREVLKGVNLSAPMNKITVLIGGSGSGKSVLMKHILGLFKPDAGSIEVFGKDMSQISEQELTAMRTKIGMLFQHAALFDSMNVEANVMFPLLERLEHESPKVARELAQHVLEQLKLEDIAHKMPTDISNGQQKRVSLARALVSRPQMMIYDEPTTGQDPMMCAYVEQMIVDAQEKFDLTSVIISHDMASTFRIGDHVAMLYQGKIIAEGSPNSLLTSEDERVREFVFAADVASDQAKADADKAKV